MENNPEAEYAKNLKLLLLILNLSYAALLSFPFLVTQNRISTFNEQIEEAQGNFSIGHVALDALEHEKASTILDFGVYGVGLSTGAALNSFIITYGVQRARRHFDENEWPTE